MNALLQERDRIEVSVTPQGCHVVHRSRLVRHGGVVQRVEEIELSCPPPVVDVTRARRARAVQ